MTKEAVRRHIREENKRLVESLDWDADISPDEQAAILLDTYGDLHGAALVGNIGFARRWSADRIVQLRSRVYNELSDVGLQLIHKLTLEEGMTN